MKNNFLTHKLLPILSIFMLCILLFCTNCFASFTYNDTVYPDVDMSEYKTNYPYYVYYTDNVLNVCLVMSSTPVCATISNGNLSFFSSNPSKVCTYIDGTGWPGFSTMSSRGDKVNFCSLGYGNEILYSNHDIVDMNTNEVVFQGAPQVPEITKALVEQTTQLGMKPLEAIKVILPVVIVTIVGLIAFWKAWQLLSKQLRKA